MVGGFPNPRNTGLIHRVQRFREEHSIAVIMCDDDTQLLLSFDRFVSSLTLHLLDFVFHSFKLG